MIVRRLVLVVLVAYVALDLGCPLVPGAFSFDPEDSVESAGGKRARQSSPQPAVVPDAPRAYAAPPGPIRPRGLRRQPPPLHRARDHAALTVEPGAEDA